MRPAPPVTSIRFLTCGVMIVAAVVVMMSVVDEGDVVSILLSEKFILVLEKIIYKWLW